jgi:hypothetical protein
MQRKTNLNCAILTVMSYSYIVKYCYSLLYLRKYRFKKKETRKKSCVARYINVSENRLGRAVKNKVFVTDF